MKKKYILFVKIFTSKQENNFVWKPELTMIILNSEDEKEAKEEADKIYEEVRKHADEITRNYGLTDKNSPFDIKKTKEYKFFTAIPA